MAKRISDDELLELAGGTDVIAGVNADAPEGDPQARQKQGGRTGGGADIDGEGMQMREYGEEQSKALF